jgi:antitoxin component YwqK of YwqJK toxin-antitoxin module
MKKIVLISMLLLMTVASFGRKHVSENATMVGDTIYYAADKMSVSSPEQASYYRLLLTEGKGMAKQNLFKDFYMDGTLKAEGGYSFVDLGNDKNTVFNGDVTTYYANGKEQMHGKFVDGKRDGYFTLQLNNGGVAVVQYNNGVSTHDYFMVTMPNGNQEKRPLSEIRSLLQ